MRKWLFFVALPFVSLLANEEAPPSNAIEFCFYKEPEKEKLWYFEVMPAYYYFTDGEMRRFFGKGGFTMRGEVGCRFWGPFIVWVDGSYLQSDGQAIGGDEALDLKLASITLGLKLIHYFHERAAIYCGAGPRLFLMMLHNDSPYVRGDDNAIGIGAGGNAGFWFFPIPKCPNIFFDLFTDYSWKTMTIEPDEISSLDSSVNVSHFTFGLGLGVRF